MIWNSISWARSGKRVVRKDRKWYYMGMNTGSCVLVALTPLNGERYRDREREKVMEVGVKLKGAVELVCELDV